MIWKNQPSIEFLNSMSQGTLVENLGIQFTELSETYLKATMPVDKRTKQPFGFLHGGASVAMAETLGSVASGLVLDNPLEYAVFGLEINANHLNAAKDGNVIGKVMPIKIGRNVHVWQIEIENEEGKPICTSRLTTMVRKKN